MNTNCLNILNIVLCIRRKTFKTLVCVCVIYALLSIFQQSFHSVLMNYVPNITEEETDYNPNVNVWDDDFHGNLKSFLSVSNTENMPIALMAKSIEIIKNKIWFMQGDVTPKPAETNAVPSLWPEQDHGDRIVKQLMYVPPNYISDLPWGDNHAYFRNYNLKKILLYFGTRGWSNLPLGRAVFLDDRCPVNLCTLVTKSRHQNTADAIIFKDRLSKVHFKRKPAQVWIIHLTNTPVDSYFFENPKHAINWTASYRHDSDIAIPHGKFVPYNESNPNFALINTDPRLSQQNFAANKNKKVAWFGTNCRSKNKRLQYVYELSTHITVDIHGSCAGQSGCSSRSCFERRMKPYKFYLAFERHSCRDYITDEFFVRGLGHNIVPIVMGAKRQDYERVAPPHSFIHVDDFESPAELAKYLRVLDRNDTLYNEYFAWRTTGEIIDSHFWCRLCAMLHAPRVRKSYEDINKWWKKRGVCDARHGWKYISKESKF